MATARPAIRRGDGIAVATSARDRPRLIYPEHRDIAIAAIAKLSTADRAALDRLWVGAPRRNSWPGCASAGRRRSGSGGSIDFVRLAGARRAITPAAPLHLTRDVLAGDWVLRVAGSPPRRKKDRAAERTDASRGSTRSPPPPCAAERGSNYITRAGANNAHFLLPRVEVAGRVRAREHRRRRAAERHGTLRPVPPAALSAARRSPRIRRGRKRAAAQSLDVLALRATRCTGSRTPSRAGHVVGTWGAPPGAKVPTTTTQNSVSDTVDWNGDRITISGMRILKPATSRALPPLWRRA